ncbi:hypothetical protein BCR34DRAFT_584164 [Clohesyomyces aquaticus]|uniref:Uncharacterized protein n=1 Tax=Clohesyomyces aquaticus TaxID=1231657 RepID=A0A1Y2A2X6_9PLEO|nr:hypothetical protein BCR34DRAFT_584164 [Clohesyomyces aquaticus]
MSSLTKLTPNAGEETSGRPQAVPKQQPVGPTSAPAPNAGEKRPRGRPRKCARDSSDEQWEPEQEEDSDFQPTPRPQKRMKLYVKQSKHELVEQYLMFQEGSETAINRVSPVENKRKKQQAASHAEIGEYHRALIFVPPPRALESATDETLAMPLWAEGEAFVNDPLSPYAFGGFRRLELEPFRELHRLRSPHREGGSDWTGNVRWSKEQANAFGAGSYGWNECPESQDLIYNLRKEQKRYSGELVQMDEEVQKRKTRTAKNKMAACQPSVQSADALQTEPHRKAKNEGERDPIRIGMREIRRLGQMRLGAVSRCDEAGSIETAMAKMAQQVPQDERALEGLLPFI